MDLRFFQKLGIMSRGGRHITKTYGGANDPLINDIMHLEVRGKSGKSSTVCTYFV